MSMSADNKTPNNYSLAPLLSVRNGARAVEFCKAAFGAVEVYRVEDPGGAVVARLNANVSRAWLRTVVYPTRLAGPPAGPGRDCDWSIRCGIGSCVNET
jgi:hypothetical protein